MLMDPHPSQQHAGLHHAVMTDTLYQLKRVEFYQTFYIDYLTYLLRFMAYLGSAYFRIQIGVHK